MGNKDSKSAQERETTPDVELDNDEHENIEIIFSSDPDDNIVKFEDLPNLKGSNGKER